MHDHVRLCSSASPSRKRTNGVALRRLDGVASRRLDGVSLRSLDGVSLRRLDGVSLRSGTDRALEFIARRELSCQQRAKPGCYSSLAEIQIPRPES